MSNGLAIAAVTAIFKNLLEDGLVQNVALSSMGNVLVTTLPPDQISIGVDGQPQLNLFLYQVSQDRNADLGKSDRSVYRQTEIEDALSPLAVNLHYVLTAYGNKDFQTEILLGYAMHLLRQTPVLDNAKIRTALNHIATINRSGLLSQAIELISIEALTEQLDRVKIAPNLFDAEQMSKVWSLFQGSYRPSITYEVSMVFSRHRKQSAALASIEETPNQPQIEKIVPRFKNSEIVVGSTLIIYGKNLIGDVTRLRLNEGESLLEPQIVEYNRILFKLPQNLQPGIQKIRVVHRQLYKSKNSKESEIVSNEQTFVLHPITNYKPTLSLQN